jgi:hypothetical protein
MKATHKTHMAVAILALGGGVYLARVAAKERHPAPSSTLPSTSPPTVESLPVIALSRDDAERVTRIELTSPDDDDKSRLQTIAIEKIGPDWEMTAPLRTQASRSKVEALLQNLQTLRLWKLVDSSDRFYDQYDLTEAKAVHIVVRQGPRAVVDLFCGKSSTDGQLVRLAGRDGILSLVNWGPQGYQGFLFTRDLRSWRETSIFKFEEEDAIKIEIINRHGVMRFSQEAGRWIASRDRRHADGRLDPPGRAWPSFDAQKVEELLRAYHALSADDFGDPLDRVRSGVDDAEKTGGIIRIALANAAAPLVLRVGKLSHGTTRWAIQDSRWAIKDGGDGTLFALAPWTAGWATADASKFERAGAGSPSP